MAKKVKMSDIAQMVGVSTVTVSKALSGQKGVSAEVRQQILSLARDLGYVHPGDRDANKKSVNIGVVVPEGYITRNQNFYWQMYQEMNKVSSENNAFIMLEIINGQDEKAGIPPKLLKENKIDALIVMGGLNTDYLIMIRNHYAIPTVYLDFYDPQIFEDSVISNGFYGSYQMTNYLLAQGCKKIVFVGTLLSTKSITDRYLGFSKALMENGYEFSTDMQIDDRDMERVMFAEMPIGKSLPDAFLCNCDMTACRVIETLKKRGIDVPTDVKVAGFDNFIYPGLCDIPLTTFDVNMAGMALTAVKLAVKKVNGIEVNTGIHMVEGKMIKRESA